MTRTTQWIVTAAAAVAAFALGWGLGAGRGSATSKEVAMTPDSPAAATTNASSASRSTTQFALLLLEDERYQGAADEASMTARVREYGDWARALAGTGRFVDGAKLADDGRLLRKADAAFEVSEGTARGGFGVLAGYFLVGADSYEEALRLAEGCPHVKYGGTVEVRRIET
jgi:hypothetical protein